MPQALRTTTRHNASRELRDLILQRDLLLHRIQTEAVRETLRKYGRLVDKLERLLRQRFGWIAERGFDASEHTARSLDRSLSVLRDEIRTAQAAIAKDLQSNLIALGRAEQAWLPSAIETALGTAAAELSVARLSSYNIAAILDTKPFGGALFKEWSRTVGENAYQRILRSVRSGMLEGKSVQNIVIDTFGKAERTAAGWVRRGGAFRVTTREAETFVRSAYQATANQARRELLKDNARVIKGVQWVATLDTRTCELCGARDGEVYDLDTLEPLTGGPPWAGGPGVLHPNCRCSQIPVLKSWRELGLVDPKLPERMRQSMDGLVPASEDWMTWAKRQNVERLIPTLGKTRARAVVNGEISLERLWDDEGKLRPLADVGLRRKVA